MGELLRSMTAREYDDWKRYERLEPFGEWRADFRMATLASLIANVNRDAKKQPQPFTVADFMPEFDAQPEPPPVDDDGNPLHVPTPDEAAQMIADFEERARKAQQTGR